jgi:sensor domain CHASE-containing protein
MVAQKVGKRVSLVEGLLSRRLRRSDTTTTPNATRDETEEIIHNERMEEANEDSAWIDGMR